MTAATIVAAPLPELKNDAVKEYEIWFWKFLDDLNSQFQCQRALMRFCTLGYINTVNENYAHPIADFLNDSFFSNLERGWDETGAVTDSAFTILSLIYIPYLFIITAKIIHNKIVGKDAFAGLPKRVPHAIAEAVIWITANVGMATLGFLPELNPIVCDLGVFAILSGALAADVVNTIIEQTRAINEIHEELNKISSSSADEKDRTKEIAELKTNLLILQCKRIITVGFGVTAVSGSACMVASNALVLTGLTVQAIEHLAFAGCYLISGAAILFAVFRLCCEVVAYSKEHSKLSAEIKATNIALSQVKREDTKQVTTLENKRDSLLLRQRHLKYEIFKSVCYYTGLTLMLGLSLVGSPAAGLIALSAFLVAHQLYVHLIEPKLIKPLLDKPIPPTPTPKRSLAYT